MTIEDRVLDVLRGRAEGVRAPEGARGAIEDAIERRRGRQPFFRVLIVCFALGLSATTFLGLKAAFDNAPRTSRLGGQTSSSTPSVTPTTAQAGAVIDLSGYPSAVTAGGGAVWVSAGNQLSKLDPSTNQLEPVLTPGPVAEAFAAGSLWVSVADGKGEAVKRIDPSANQVLATIPFAAGHILPIIAGDGTAIWVLDMENRPGGSLALAKIDPATNAVVDSISLDHAVPSSPNEVWVPRGLADGEGAVWILDAGVVGGIGRDGLILRVDPTTDRVTDTVPIGYANNFVVGAGAIWTNVEGTGPVRIDAQTLEIQPLHIGYFEPFAIGDGGVWFLDRMGHEVDVARLNTETLQVDISVPVGGFPSTVGLEPVLEPVSNSIWVPDDDNNKLYRVDLR